VPFVLSVHIPAATITFQGVASVHAVEEAPREIARLLLRGLDRGGEAHNDTQYHPGATSGRVRYLWRRCPATRRQRITCWAESEALPI
jgi:hypothetical protein